MLARDIESVFSGGISWAYQSEGFDGRAKKEAERGVRKLSLSDFSKLVLNEENSTTIKSVSMASHPAVAKLFMPHKFTMRMQKIYTWRLCISKGLLED